MAHCTDKSGIPGAVTLSDPDDCTAYLSGGFALIDVGQVLQILNLDVVLTQLVEWRID
jgi:hypothetical protein